jgi:Zn-dependent M28 family amino/carboxypeptidase
MQRVAPVLAALVLACGGKPPPSPPAPARTPAPATAQPQAAPDDLLDRAAEAITPSDLRQTITDLSDDKLEGRGPTTPADKATRSYLIDRLTKLGYAPGGADGSWEQPVDVVGIQAHMPKLWKFGKGGKSVSLAWSEQWIAGSGVQTKTASVKNAELVFVGYGIQAPEYGWDDFKGKDLKGKVLVVLNNDPDWDPALFGGETRLYYGRWTYKYESAARQGAAGAIIIHTTPSAGYPWQVVQTSWSGREFELPATSDEPRIQIRGWVTEDAAKQLAALGGHDLGKLVESAHHKEFQPVPLGVTTSIDFSNDVSTGQTANVLGILRGSDPTLASEVVVYTAHHDHLGVGKPDASGDTIYNGALDNGAGCAQVMAIAAAYKALPAPPRRSILIAFVAAEEQGLLGSRYFATHPTLPIDKVVVDINYDGGNIWSRTTDVAYVGKGKTTLDPIVDKYAAHQHRTVKPDQFPDRGMFYRSDQLSFARAGVPGLHLTAGADAVGKPAGWMHQQVVDYEEHHYHQPSDQIQPSWVFDGMIDDARLGFLVGASIANSDSRPSFLPNDEFAHARVK